MNISIIEFANQANSIDKGKFSIEDHISYIDLEVFMDKEYDLSNGNDQYDMAANSLIEDHFDTLVNSDAVFINYVGNDSDKFFGLILAHHIRLDKMLRKLAILITGSEYKSSLMEYEPDLSHLIHTGGTGYFSNIEEAISNIQKLRSIISLLKITPSAFKGGILDKLVVRQPEEQQGRHGIANQWGAYRMYQVGGLEINYKFPSTLYFKYLLAQSNNPDSKTITFPSVGKILFIDDNHHKGWKDCLEQIFGKGKIMAYKSWEEALENQVPDQISRNEFALIILDLYFGESTNLNKEKGKDILKKIKGTKTDKDNTIKGLNPVVPVIMFTASNKAWNMDELYEAGADGYYVKEHPDTAHDAEFSIKNFENFHKTVKNCLEKGSLLMPYWRKIIEIKKSNFIVNNFGQKNKERINERLTMFLGLLKKSFEQTKFDKDIFLYSEWELAFLTLWSALNEIQELFYEKDSRFIPYRHVNSNGVSELIRSHLGNRTNLGSGQTNWKIVRSSYYLFVYRPKLDNYGNMVKYNDYSYYMVPYTTIFRINESPYFEIRSEYERIHLKNDYFSYSKNLYMQIAFLIDKINPSKSQLYRDNLWKSIFICNEERNKLYLAHGEDSSSPSFAVEYKDQRLSDVDWKKYIQQLFEIIYFLCTGKECDWNN